MIITYDHHNYIDDHSFSFLFLFFFFFIKTEIQIQITEIIQLGDQPTLTHTCEDGLARAYQTLGQFRIELNLYQSISRIYVYFCKDDSLHFLIIIPLFSKHFTTFSINSNHRNQLSFHSRSRPFPGIIASDSRSRILGKFFFIPFPFPNFGNAFFHSLPVPEFWEWIFSFPSRSRILGMEFSIPFPFPNFGNGIFYSRSRSRTLKSHSRSPLVGGGVGVFFRLLLLFPQIVKESSDMQPVQDQKCQWHSCKNGQVHFPCFPFNTPSVHFPI